MRQRGIIGSSTLRLVQCWRHWPCNITSLCHLHANTEHGPMMAWFWVSVCDAGPDLSQHWATVSWLLGYCPDTESTKQIFQKQNLVNEKSWTASHSCYQIVWYPLFVFFYIKLYRHIQFKWIPNVYLQHMIICLFNKLGTLLCLILRE